MFDFEFAKLTLQISIVQLLNVILKHFSKQWRLFVHRFDDINGCFSSEIVCNGQNSPLGCICELNLRVLEEKALEG